MGRQFQSHHPPEIFRPPLRNNRFVVGASPIRPTVSRVPHNGIYRFNTESQSHVTYYYKTLRGKLLLCGFTARNDENWTMVHLNLYRGNLSREAFPLGASACLFLTSIRHSRESFHVVPLSPFCRKCRCDAHGNFTTWRFLRSNLFTDCHAVHHRFTLHRALSYSNICVH